MAGKRVYFKWDEAKRAVALEMWPAHSATQIAERIGGVTRSAVLGFLNRQGLLGEKQTKARLTAQGRRQRKNERLRVWRAGKRLLNPKPPKFRRWVDRTSAASLPIGFEPLNIPFPDLKPTECLWPTEAGCRCGHEIHESHPSYCEAHAVYGGGRRLVA